MRSACSSRHTSFTRDAIDPVRSSMRDALGQCRARNSLPHIARSRFGRSITGGIGRGGEHVEHDEFDVGDDEGTQGVDDRG